MADFTLDLRSPSRDQLRYRARSKKYDAFKRVKPGQVGLPHYLPVTDTTVSARWSRNPLIAFSFRDTVTALPAEAPRHVMTKEMLYKEAQAARADGYRCRCWSCDQGSKRENVGRNRDSFWLADGVEARRHYLRSAEEGSCEAASGCLEWWDMEALWSMPSNDHGVREGFDQTYFDFGPLVEKAEREAEERRWMLKDEEWSRISEGEVGEERLVVLDCDDIDWRFEDDWESVVAS